MSSVDEALAPGACISLSDITQAAFRIRGLVAQTTCIESTRMSEVLGANVFFKREYEHRTGSFKERGAANVLKQLSEEQRRRGVCAASAGNHALAVAYHGQRLGIPVSVVMPIVAPITKVQNCRKFGANVIVEGEHLLESRKVAAQLEEEQDLLYINGYDDPGIIAGQGVVGLEMLNQIHNLDAVVVPIGGGGLIAGMALAIKTLNPAVRVVGVESNRCASWQAALQAGQPVPIDMGGRSTLADGLAVTTVGANAFTLAKDLIDEVVSVSEASIALAVLRLLEEERCVVEGGGAVGVAGFLDGKLDSLKGMRVGVVLCGGNIDTPVLGRVIERGLAADGRIHRFTARVSDRPGGIASLTTILAAAGASVKDINHERAYLKEDIAMVSITVGVETRNSAHAAEVQERLQDAGMDFDWYTGSAVVPTH